MTRFAHSLQRRDRTLSKAAALLVPLQPSAVHRAGYVFAGGGTGGHLFPAIAVARGLRVRQPDVPVLFVGSDREHERALLQPTGFEHLGLSLVSRSQIWRHPCAFTGKLWTACRAARRVLRERRPRVVIGCGGFASFPAVWAARREGVPIVLLEQNVLPGRATRWLSRWAETVCLAFEESREWLPWRVRTVVTGNPVRSEIASLATRSGMDESSVIASGQVGNLPHDGQRTLLVLGGSLGSRSLNDAVLSALQRDVAGWQGWRIIHQTGTSDCDRVRALYAELGLPARVAAFLPELPALLAARPLVISRAGATTLAELACAGCPTIAVPWKGAADDHQTINARWYADRGTMLMAAESAADGVYPSALTIQDALHRLRFDDVIRTQFPLGLQAVARPAATATVVAVLDAMASRRTPTETPPRVMN